MPATPLIDITPKKAAAAKVLADAQVYRTAAGQAQKAADKAAKALPIADKVSVQATAASGIYDKVDLAQRAIVAAGGDPSVLSDLVAYADTLVQSSRSYLLDIEAAIDG